MKDGWEIKITTHKNQRIIGVIIFYFLITFILSRLMVYLVIGKWLPNFFLTIRGVHIHHFTYGVFLLVLIGLFLILRRPHEESESFKFSTAFYGIGLGLTFDEFGMWIRLADEYWLRQSYDAIIIILLLLLNIAYYRQVLYGVREVGKLFKKVFLRLFSMT